MANKVPIVAIVGRANVGKSSLFNAILKRREAIVADEPGTTRDSITAKASWNGHDFWLVDTAGLKTAQDDFEFTIQEQITQAADSADIIVVVNEADVPITDDDRKVATMALKTKKPVILLVNKSDKVREVNVANAQKLGIKQIFATSVTQNQGIEDFLDELANQIPRASIKVEDDRVRIALLGRPNVGKSALFNALAKKQQAIVADRAGTTRDINRTIVRYQGKEIELLDTAGIRRSGKIEKGIEKFSVIRSLSAIEQADVCLLLMDVNELNVQLDQKIAGLIKESGKGLILVVSKWDSFDKDPFSRDQLAANISATFDFVPWASLIFTSSITGQNVTRIFEQVLEVMVQREKRLPTAQLNRWLAAVTDKHPPASVKNAFPHLRYMIQETEPGTPNFQIHGSHTKLVHWSYRRYLEKELRKEFGFEGTPVKIWLIDSDPNKPFAKKQKD